MDQLPVILATVIILILIAAVFVFFKSSELEINPLVSATIDYPASQEGLASALADSSNRISLRSPTTISWNPGEVGSFALAVRNKYEEERPFYFSIFPEKHNGQQVDSGLKALGKEWAIYPSKKTIPQETAEVIEIVIKPINPPQGNYIFRVVLCEASECDDVDSASLYATTTFSFSIG